MSPNSAARKLDTGQMSLMDELAATLRKARPVRKARVPDFVPPAPKSELRTQLVAIAVRLLHEAGDYGVIVGEVVQLAESPPYSLRVGGEPMEDKMKQQRQTAWLAHVMPEAGGIPTGDTRPSPLKRHHKKPQRVYVARKVADV